MTQAKARNYEQNANRSIQPRVTGSLRLDPEKRPKIFGMPPCHPLDREAKSRVKWYARVWNKAHRQNGQHIGPITRAYMDVLWAVLDFANTKTGTCFPSHAAIANKAGCCRDTVIEGLKALEDAGVLRVINRMVRAGSRVLRTSNAYVFRDIAPVSEIPARTKPLKDLDLSITSPPPKVTVLDPRRSMIDAALAKFGVSAGYL